MDASSEYAVAARLGEPIYKQPEDVEQNYQLALRALLRCGRNMKSLPSIVLLLCGTLIFLAPMVLSYSRGQLALSTGYAFGCWLIGTILLLTGAAAVVRGSGSNG